MKNLLLLTFLSAGLLAVSGCMHTVIGDGYGKSSPDGQHSLAISCHGASAHAYVDKTKKRVYLWIMQQGRQEAIFQRQYKFVAADLAWRTRWQDTDDVSVVFFDFGDKISRYDAKKTRAPSNHVATLQFHRDSATGLFSETK